MLTISLESNIEVPAYHIKDEEAKVKRADFRGETAANMRVGTRLKGKKDIAAS